MLSFRAFTRSVPRLSQSVARASLRPAALSKPAFTQPWKQVSKPAYAAFSTSSAFREPAAEGKLTYCSIENKCELYLELSFLP